MSNQGQAPEPVAPQEPKPKQFLLMIDEVGAAFLGRICPGIQFVQVEGINMQGSETHYALVTPMAKPAEPVPVPEAPKVD